MKDATVEEKPREPRKEGMKELPNEEPVKGQGPPHDLMIELEKVTKERDEQKERYLRLAAEFDNFRKKTLKEQEEFRKYAHEKLMLELIDVWEGLERGIENSKKSERNDKLIEGMEMVNKELKKVLTKYGLTPIKTVGEKFDPYKHEAMMQTETDEWEEDTILEEFARGYMLNNKVIRYSKVRVSKRKESKEENEVN